jgi:hypothetical protein
MESASILITGKDSWVYKTIWFLYKSLTGYWFSKPHVNLPQKPVLYQIPNGVMLGGRIVYTILVTTSLVDMIMTDADAILANFYWIPPISKLNELFSTVNKPVVISIRKRFLTKPKLAATIKKLEAAGTGGLFTGSRVSLSGLKYICLASSVPVFAASRPEMEEIKSKINAGAFAVCIQGKTISKELMRSLHRSFPGTPVIAVCNRSEKLIAKSVNSGTDAVIFKPCVPFSVQSEPIDF